jgi:hypothetical protein
MKSKGSNKKGQKKIDFGASHTEGISELIRSISESLRHQDGRTLQDVARLCGLDVTYLGNFMYEVRHG